jgi:hypothetical protein
MISFCDIPLSLAKDQIERYGSYAIGMSKAWGIKNYLNPVVYIEKDSLLAKDIQTTLDNMVEMADVLLAQVEKIAESTRREIQKVIDKVKFFKENVTPEINASAKKELNHAIENVIPKVASIADYQKLTNKLREIGNNSGNLFRYIKNYEGTLIRNDKTTPNYRFYDEREWRYVPALNDDRVKKYLNAVEFKKYRGLNKNKPFVENINLPFTGDDIKYLIVKSNKDIPKLIKAIKGTDNLTKNPNEADILATRILTVEQLNNDF